MYNTNRKKLIVLFNRNRFEFCMSEKEARDVYDTDPKAVRLITLKQAMKDRDFGKFLREYFREYFEEGFSLQDIYNRYYLIESCISK